MNKKSIALIVIGIGIGAFAMMAFGWIVVAMPDVNTLEYCGKTETMIVTTADVLFAREDVEPTELELQRLMQIIDRWVNLKCYIEMPDEAPLINGILERVESKR